RCFSPVFEREAKRQKTSDDPAAMIAPVALASPSPPSAPRAPFAPRASIAPSAPSARSASITPSALSGTNSGPIVGPPPSFPWLRSGRCFAHHLVIQSATMEVASPANFKLEPDDQRQQDGVVVQSSQSTVTDSSPPMTPRPVGLSRPESASTRGVYRPSQTIISEPPTPFSPMKFIEPT
ncbi:hypothetical protein L917_19566, partial [Phytophthora nicotianae]